MDELADSDGSRFGFLRMGEMDACLNLDGKNPSESNRFARWAIILEKRAEHDLSKKVRIKSRTDLKEYG